MAKSNAGIYGIAHIALFDENGELKWEERKQNLITTAGDQYYCRQGCTGVGGNTAPTLAWGMQLGTGSTAVAKSGVNAAEIDTYITASNSVFTAVTPAVVSGDTGWDITYSSSWAAGVATNSAIVEAVITTSSANSASSVAATLSRVVFTAIDKGALDTLVLNWEHVFFDAP